MSSCWWCGGQFEATDAAQRFCRATHAKKAGQARARHLEYLALKRLQQGLPLCPHPLKVGYPSMEAAQRAALEGGMTAYACVCGSRHVGHPMEGVEEAVIRSLGRQARRRERRQLERLAAMREQDDAPALP